MGTPFIGEIRIFAGNFAPAGWSLCNGQLLPISENDALFSLLGTTYGGDGQNTFGLPDLRGRIPVHTGASPGGSTYQQGETGGAEQVTLTTAQLPSHSHTPLGQSANGAAAPTNSFWAASATQSIYTDQAPSLNMNSAAIGNTGGSQPHENMMPFVGLNFIISLFGVYPSRA